MRIEERAQGEEGREDLGSLRQRGGRDQQDAVEGGHEERTTRTTILWMTKERLPSDGFLYQVF